VPGVRRVSELLVTFLGPRRLWVLARVEIDDRLDGADVASLVGTIEQTLRLDVTLSSRPCAGHPADRSPPFPGAQVESSSPPH